VAGEKGSSIRRPFYPLTGPLKNFYGVPSLSRETEDLYIATTLFPIKKDGKNTAFNV
jgi:hypothetical protein